MPKNLNPLVIHSFNEIFVGREFQRLPVFGERGGVLLILHQPPCQRFTITIFTGRQRHRFPTGGYGIGTELSCPKQSGKAIIILWDGFVPATIRFQISTALFRLSWRRYYSP